MTAALYGPGGFFVAGAGPAAHFRTSAHTGPAFAAALLRLLERVDTALDRPDPLDLVDLGAGRGELLHALAGLAPPALTRRLRLTAVELAPRPATLPDTITWRDTPPPGVTGLLVATEWLDNVPLDVAVGAAGPPADRLTDRLADQLADPFTDRPAGRATGWRAVLVDPATGAESPGGPVAPDAARWLADWWPAAPGGRAEVGLSRDAAWAAAVATVRRGAALAVDYGHLRSHRPPLGTLTGYRDGREVPPVPDGSCDLTAHVAIDSVAAAGAAVAGRPYALVRQRAAVRALGVDGTRPPLALASTDPAGYVRALSAASVAAELTDPAGLGGHWWLLQPVGIDVGIDVHADADADADADATPMRMRMRM